MMSREGKSTGTGIGMGAAENPQTQKEQEQQRQEQWAREGSRAFESSNPTAQGKNDELMKKEESLRESNAGNGVCVVRGMGAM